MSQDWDIKPLAGACRTCGQAFRDGQAYCSCLAFMPEGYVRADHCETCWAAHPQPQAAHSQWKGVYRAPPPAPEPALRKETAESLLRRLMEDHVEDDAPVVFILAVMLERNRLFVERDVQKRDDGSLVRVYEHRKTGETFLVPDPRLRLNELEDVQQKVVALLGGKPAAAPAATASAPAPATPGPAEV